MSKLNDFIQEFCPDGVQYKTLGEIGKISMCKRIMKSETSPIGDVPFYKIGTFGGVPNAFISQGTFEKYKALYPYPKKGDILISAAGTIGRTVIFDGKPSYYQDSNIVWIDNDESIVLNKYLYYCYQQHPWQISTGGTIARLYNDNIGRAKIPVPPLPVQSEIVRVLDTFTELTAELTTELTTRKQQCSYYRDKLLTFDDTVNIAPLGEIANVFRGEYITKKSTREGEIPVILGGQEPAYYIDTANHEGEIVVVARSGASAGFVSYWNQPIFVTDGFGYEGKKNVATTKYLYYILKNMESALNAMKRGAGVPHVSGETLAKIMLPIPPINEQHRIVALLDKFDALCNNLTSGLPAEIEARQKQYEYYRDKLLDFKPNK